MRVCKKCLIPKLEAEYSLHKASSDGVRTICKSCSNEHTRNWRRGKETHIRETESVWRLANSERSAYLYRKANLKKYNLTVEQYDSLLASQLGVCAICMTSEPGGRGRFHVDHDHSCCPGTANSCGNCVRGLLCHKCNVMLAHAKDDVQLLADAIVYLLDWENSGL